MKTVARDALRLPGPIRMDLITGAISPDARVEHSLKTIGQLKGIFLDEAAKNLIDAEQVVYKVDFWRPVDEGTEGGLFWGNSTILPGVVGDEYFMTRGHFHLLRNRAEFYSTVSGSGMLVLMDEQRHSVVQQMTLGTTHYIPGGIAHRVVNTGDVPLTLVACWPSDAGHDYATIDEQGFSLRIMRRSGRPAVVEQP